jgi:5-methylcytosine-specific restriction protein A
MNRPIIGAVLCVDCGNPTRQRPRCEKCEGKRHTAQDYGHQWTKIRRAYLRARPLCEVRVYGKPCGKRATGVDHIIPKSEGWTHDWSNLQAICTPHHKAKSKRERTAALLRSQS